MNESPKVLDGVRILELARWQAAPRGGLVLRDMGAEVIKVEWRKGADLRNSGPFVGEMSVQFAAYNRGKKSISLNTRHDKGKKLFLWGLIMLRDCIKTVPHRSSKCRTGWCCLGSLIHMSICCGVVLK